MQPLKNEKTDCGKALEDLVPGRDPEHYEVVMKNNPVAILQAVKYIVDIAEGIASIAEKLGLFGSRNDAEIAKALQGINQRLGLLLDGQLRIIDELRKLKFVFREELTRNEIAKLHRETQAWIFALNQNVSRLTDAGSDQERGRILESIEESLLGPAGQQLYLPTFWGAGAFSTSAISYSAWIQTALITSQKESFLAQGLSQYSSAFVTAKENAEEVLALSESEKKNLEEKVKKRLSNRKIRTKKDVRDWDSGADTCSGKNVTYTFLNIEGNLQTGFTGRKSQERGQWNLRCRVYRNGPFRKSDLEEISAIALDSLGEFSSAEKRNDYDHKGIVATLNARRKAIMGLTVKIAELNALIPEIERLIESVAETRRQIGLPEA